MDAYDQARTDKEMLVRLTHPRIAGPAADPDMAETDRLAAEGEHLIIPVGMSADQLEIKRDGGHPVRVGAFRPYLATGVKTTIRSSDGEEFPGTCTGCDRLGRWEILLAAPGELCSWWPHEPHAGSRDGKPRQCPGLRAADYVPPGDGKRCQVDLIHEDKSAARCILPRTHLLDDSDHVDEHGHHAKVLVTQATLREVERVGREWPDGVRTCEELQRLEPGRPCTCGRCPKPAPPDLAGLAGAGPYLHGYMTGVAQELRALADWPPGSDVGGMLAGMAQDIETVLSRLREES